MEIIARRPIHRIAQFNIAFYRIPPQIQVAEFHAKVITAIRTVLAGQMFVSERMTATILQRMSSGGQRVEGGDPTDVLTDRETEVFQLLGQGVGVKQIAENLFVSVKTVEAHREHIKHKLKLKTSAELLRYAIEYKLQDR